MADEPEPPPSDVPDGAAVFPEVPPELGVHPLLLGMIHAYVFLEGSTPEIVNPAAAEEALQYMVEYLQRLSGADLKRVREDLQALVGFAKHEKMPKMLVRFLQDFLKENGIPD